MKKLLLTTGLLFFGAFVLLAEAKTIFKKQVFISGGLVIPRSGVSKSIATVGGVALVFPLTKSIFVRPAAAGGLVKPLASGKKRSFTLQPVCFLGWKITKRTAVLAGGGATILFPPNAPRQILSTAVFATATRIWHGWGISTPISFNNKSYGVALQIVYTQ